MAPENPEKATEQKTPASASDPKDKKLTLQEYQALKKGRQQKSKGIQIPKPIKIILLIPVFFLFLLGLIFLPWIAFKIFTTPLKDTSTHQTQSATHRK